MPTMSDFHENCMNFTQNESEFYQYKIEQAYQLHCFWENGMHNDWHKWEEFLEWPPPGNRPMQHYKTVIYRFGMVTEQIRECFIDKKPAKHMIFENILQICSY